MKTGASKQIRQPPTAPASFLGPLLASKLEAPTQQFAFDKAGDLLLCHATDVLPCRLCDEVRPTSDMQSCAQCRAREHISCSLRQGRPVLVSSSSSSSEWCCSACRAKDHLCALRMHAAHLNALFPP